MLVGRDRERREIEDVLTRARSGASATMALVGESGIGKTALLEYAAEGAKGMQILRARGIESETQIPFAALLELLRPALALLEAIPEPQAAALEGALALRPDKARERFAVGAATLSLLSSYAEQRPVAVLIDDAHWIDAPSAQALLFAFRRLLADSVAVLIAVREGEPSLLDGSDLPTLRLAGLTIEESGALAEVPPETAARLCSLTGGNPLALLELRSRPDELAFAAEGGPPLVPGRIAQAFVRRLERLDDAARRALVLAATSESGDLGLLGRAAAGLEVDLETLERAESVGLVSLGTGSVEFRHPLARSAIYASAPAAERRAAHRALAGALPDRDVDRRAWHLAAAAVGTDETATAALEQAGDRAQQRSAYASAAAAFGRAARMTADPELRTRLLSRAAEAEWDAGLGDRALALLGEARAAGSDAAVVVEVDALAGRITTRRGPVMRGHQILAAAAEHASAEHAVEMLCEAANACFYAGNPSEMLSAAERARARLPEHASVRTRFLAAVAFGMASIVGGEPAAGADSLHQAITLAENSPELQTEVALLPWLAIGPLFLREANTGRWLVEKALNVARERAAIGTLPFLLNLIARDQAATDRWAVAEATYREAMELARESDQRTDLAFSLSGLAWLQARRGRERDCRACAEEALGLCQQLGTRLHEIWSLAALGELELALGYTGHGIERFEHQRQLLSKLGITDPDLSPAPELVEAYMRLGRDDRADRLVSEFSVAASAKGQPWSLARASRCQGLVADDAELQTYFERALEHHAQTPDSFETARTQLVYGERLRRARRRVLAREQLRGALKTFERLDARPWADRAHLELAATGETLRPRDPTLRDELTPRELQIALTLAGGKTTREAAASLFLSPKTVEYHLRHVYQKLDVHSRTELATALARQTPVPGASARA